MTQKEVLEPLEAFGEERTKNTFLKHGAKEPLFGVKVGDLKKILKKTKKDHALSLELYATGNSDAMYLAGLMADEKQITAAHLEDWLGKAYWYYLSEFTVPWLAAETDYGFELAKKWIESKKEGIASAGWATFSNFASIRPDEVLNLETYSQLLDRVGKEIENAQNRVRYTMNGFIIAVGSYIPVLIKKAQEIAAKIGKVSVEMGGTSCKVPLASAYIQKVIDKSRIGKKCKQARC
jgi:3-methyladenine DNA glycosylase AlkD